MKLDYYLHGLKWKTIETKEEDLKKGFVPFYIFDKLTNMRESISGNVEVKKIYFQIQYGPWEDIQFSDVYEKLGMSSNQMNSIIHMAKMRVPDLEFRGMKIQEVNLREGYFSFGDRRANCDDPHIYVDFNGELAYRDINIEETQSVLVKIKKSIFDIIDLES